MKTSTQIRSVFAWFFVRNKLIRSNEKKVFHICLKFSIFFFIFEVVLYMFLYVSIIIIENESPVIVIETYKNMYKTASKMKRKKN